MPIWIRIKTFSQDLLFSFQVRNCLKSFTVILVVFIMPKLTKKSFKQYDRDLENLFFLNSLQSVKSTDMCLSVYTSVHFGSGVIQVESPSQIHPTTWAVCL